MAKEKNIGLLIDIDNAKISLEVFNSILAALRKSGNLIYVKIYGFNERKHIKFNAIIEENGFKSMPTMRFKKRAKSQQDLRIIIDAMKLFYTAPHINAYCIIMGEGDLVPLLSFMRSGGKDLITIEDENSQDPNYHMFNETIKLDIEYITPRAKAFTKKELSAKLKAISERSAELDMSNKNYETERDKLLQEIEDLLYSRTDEENGDEEENEMFENLQSLLDVLKSSI